MGGASGIVELLCSVLALQHGELPGTLNCEHPFPDCPITVNTVPLAVTKPYALKLSHTDLGQCAAAVVKRWED
jgi:3-oxoacyl-[acyl-carrier-protein] synthase II